MDPSQIVSEAQAKFQNALNHFQDELKKIRTGRAQPGMLDGLIIEAYGVQMPLVQVGSVSTPEPQLLQITPFDPNNLQAITAAIRDNQSLGLNPMDDGRVVRVPIPPLTEERRREYVKLVGSKTEECMIALRNARHDAHNAIDKAKKDKEIGEDEAKRLEKQVDDAMNKARGTADSAAEIKEQEIMNI